MKQQSIYAQDRVTLFDRLYVDLGLRYDWIETDAETWAADPTQRLKDEELSTSFAVLYAMENGVSPYVSYSSPSTRRPSGPTPPATPSTRPGASNGRPA